MGCKGKYDNNTLIHTYKMYNIQFLNSKQINHLASNLSNQNYTLETTEILSNKKSFKCFYLLH